MRGFVVLVTNRCNFKCGHCFREGASAEDIDLDLVASCLPSLKRLGVGRVALTGGEPILHPRFDALVELLANDGFRLGIVTNGWCYEDYLERLEPFRQQIAYVAFSLDGSAPQHDSLRGKKGSFARVITAIERFHAAGYWINVSHIVNRHTVDELYAFGRLMAHKPLYLSIGQVIHANGNEPWRLLPKQRATLQHTVERLRREMGERISAATSLGINQNPLFCKNFGNLNDMALRYNGDLLFCCDCPSSNRGGILGNLADEPFDEIVRRFPHRVGAILSRRLSALHGDGEHGNNDCDFCNRVLAETFSASPSPPAKNGLEGVRSLPTR